MEGPQRAPRAQKKSLSDALEYAARQGATDHKQLKAIQIAKLINLMSGGAVIAAWEVDQLDEEWIDAFRQLARLPAMRASYQAFDRKLADIRQKHPTYRKYLN